MATKHELILALRNADAAGDVESAKRIAAMIGSQQAIKPEQTFGQKAFEGLKSVPSKVVGVAENIGSIAAAVPAQIAGGVAGSIAGLSVGAANLLGLTDLEGSDIGANVSRDVSGAITDFAAPRTDAGKQVQQAIGQGAEFIGENIIKPAVTGAVTSPLIPSEFTRKVEDEGLTSELASRTLSATDSPLLASIVATIPTALSIAVPGAKGLEFGKLAQIVSKEGKISASFEKALADRGLTHSNLVEAVRAKLPELTNNTKGLTNARASQNAAESIVKEQIKAGGRDDALATIRLSNNKIIDDNLAKDIIKQGYQEGTVQLAKTATASTKKEMAKALGTAFDITKQSRLAQTKRPSDFAGKALFDRVKFIKNEANAARKELNNIAKNELNGAQFDVAPIKNKINEIFSDLDIEDIGTGGIPKPNFKGSQISGDRSSQRAISEMIRILKESKRSDALGGHLMKKQFDDLINFSKQPKQGLGKSGETALRSVRSTINDTLRASNSEYARVNDIMSKSLTGMDDLQKAIGTSIDLSASGAESALGTSIRGLFSNRQKRQQLGNSFDAIDDIANDLGGKFDVNYKDIAQFANEIEDIFGTVAKTSFKGDIGGAIRDVSTKGATMTAVDAGVGAVARKAEQLRGVNTFNAFKTMRDLLERKNN